MGKTLFDHLPAAEWEWPRLSTSLAGPRDLEHCWNCRRRVVAAFDEQAGQRETEEGAPLAGVRQIFQEHDGQDKPEPVVVVLCGLCSEALIERHPRLYRRLERFEPFPGAMLCCVGCRHGARGGGCSLAAAERSAGGTWAEWAKVNLSFPHPTQMHVSRRGRGQKSALMIIYNGPVACRLREENRNG